MAAKYEIIDSLNLKYVTISGSTNLAELRDLARNYLDDPLFSLEQSQFIDLEALTDAKARFMDVFTLRNFYLREYGPVDEPVRVAMYAPSSLGYGVCRMFSSLMSGQKLMSIKIFERKNDALEWLDINPYGTIWMAAKASIDTPSLPSNAARVEP